jgi:hypothetical protein
MRIKWYVVDLLRPYTPGVKRWRWMGRNKAVLATGYTSGM